MRGVTRSEFLKLAALGGAGATLLGACGSDSGDAGLATPRASAGDGSPSPSPRASREPARSAVLAVARSENAADNTARAVAALGGMRAFVKRNDVVVIKPNICTASAPEYAATTNPHVVATLVRLARDGVLIPLDVQIEPHAVFTRLRAVTRLGCHRHMQLGDRRVELSELLGLLVDRQFQRFRAVHVMKRDLDRERHRALPALLNDCFHRGPAAAAGVDGGQGRGCRGCLRATFRKPCSIV